jgi:hypothetical protein
MDKDKLILDGNTDFIDNEVRKDLGLKPGQTYQDADVGEFEEDNT